MEQLETLKHTEYTFNILNKYYLPFIGTDLEQVCLKYIIFE